MESKNKIKLTKEQASILNDLYSNDELKIEQSIIKLREKGGVYSIEPLMNVYFNTSFSGIRKSIGNLFSDTKDYKVAEIIYNNLSKYGESEYLGDFLSTLWQSSIKFDNLQIFTELFILSDDKTAFECVTIIEQNTDHNNEEAKNICIDILKSNIAQLKGFKKDLALQLLDLLSK